MGRKYTYEDYHRVIELLEKGLGPTEISRKLNIKKHTIKNWIYRKMIPPLARWHPEPSSELAYVIGVLLGDGYIIRKHRYEYNIELTVKDHEFAETFSRAMAKVLNKKYKRPYWNRTLNAWNVCYHSKAFYTWYRRQNLEILKPHIEYNKDIVKHFLRGLYDSEGTNYKCRRVWLYNNDKDLLKYAKYLLVKYFNIKPTEPYLASKAGSIHKIKGEEKIKQNHNTYRLVISKRRYVEKFLNEIGFSIREKQLGLKRRK